MQTRQQWRNERHRNRNCSFQSFYQIIFVEPFPGCITELCDKLPELELKIGNHQFSRKFSVTSGKMATSSSNAGAEQIFGGYAVEFKTDCPHVQVRCTFICLLLPSNAIVK